MSTTHVIPGGTAEFREQSELTERQKRTVMKAGTKMPAQAITSPALAVDGQVVAGETGPGAAVFDISETDLDGMWAFADAYILAYLKSWTLDQPLPATEDDLLDLPGDLYDALQTAIADVQKKANGPDGFGPDSAPDLGSPTGA